MCIYTCTNICIHGHPIHVGTASAVYWRLGLHPPSICGILCSLYSMRLCSISCAPHFILWAMYYIVYDLCDLLYPVYHTLNFTLFTISKSTLAGLYTCRFMHACMHIHMYMHVRRSKGGNMYQRLHPYLRTCMDARVPICMYVYRRICIHMNCSSVYVDAFCR